MIWRIVWIVLLVLFVGAALGRDGYWAAFDALVYQVVVSIVAISAADEVGK